MPKPKPKSVRQPNLTLHIYCEGEKTEPNYLEGYIQTRFPGDKSKRVVKVEPTKKNTPVQLVKEAVGAKKGGKYLPGDEFWVVYDRESLAKYDDKLHAQARKTAQDNGVYVALSNVCFELWILLHFQDNSAPYSCCDDLLASASFKAALKKVGIENYQKGSEGIFRILQPAIADAKARAAKMNQNTRNTAPPNVTHAHQLNPFTEVHTLLEAIDAFKAKK